MKFSLGNLYLGMILSLIGSFAIFAAAPKTPMYVYMIAGAVTGLIFPAFSIKKDQ